MKRIFFFVLLTLSLTTYAQDNAIEEYCSIEMRANFLFNNKKEIKEGHSIAVDYGKNSLDQDQTELLKGSEGKALKFFSSIQVLNFMGKNGWSLVSVIPLDAHQYASLGGGQNIDIKKSLFLFKRKAITK